MHALEAVNTIIKACWSALAGHRGLKRPVFYITPYGDRTDIAFASPDIEAVANEAVYNGRTPRRIMLGELGVDGMTITPVVEVAHVNVSMMATLDNST